MPEIKPPALDPVDKPAPITQSGMIIKMLKAAGSKGVPNYEFPRRQILRYSARIDELRKDGHNIYCERQFINGKATGVFLYYLTEES